MGLKTRKLKSETKTQNHSMKDPGQRERRPRPRSLNPKMTRKRLRIKLHDKMTEIESKDERKYETKESKTEPRRS